LLVVLHLVEQGALPAPLLPISTYLEQRRVEYYERLQAVRERGEIGAWLRYFLSAVATVARAAVSRAERLMDLREKYRAGLRARGHRSAAWGCAGTGHPRPVVGGRRAGHPRTMTVS
jgi:Fic family protein